MLGKYIITFLISMVPIIEIRGAVPYAVGMGLPEVNSIIVAILGNMLPVPFIYLFAKKVIRFTLQKNIIIEMN